MSGELIEERWLPTRSISSIMMSIMSMLNDPNINSPANLTASIQYRDEREKYIEKCKAIAQQSLAFVPDHVKIAHPETNPIEKQAHIAKHKALTVDEILEYSVEEDISSEQEIIVEEKINKKSKNKEKKKAELIEEVEEELDDIERNNLLEIDPEFPASILECITLEQSSIVSGKLKKASPSKGVKLNQLSILTFNVLRYSTANGEKRISHIFDILRESQADIIGLNDVSYEFYKSLLSEDWMKDYYITSTQLSNDKLFLGSLLITRIPHQQVLEYKLPTRSNKTIRVSKIDVNNKPLNFVHIHLDESKLDVKLRIRQMTEIEKIVNKLEGDTFIFGDFYFGDKSKEAKFINDNWKDAWIEINPKDPGYTYDPNSNSLLRFINTKALPSRRDRIMFKSKKDNISVNDAELLGTKKLKSKYKNVNLWPSDHYAVRASFSLSNYSTSNQKSKKEKRCIVM